MCLRPEEFSGGATSTRILDLHGLIGRKNRVILSLTSTLSTLSSSVSSIEAGGSPHSSTSSAAVLKRREFVNTEAG